MPPRVPSHEALDDAEVASGFARVSLMPQMRLLRSYVVRRALTMVESGLACDVSCGNGLLAVELAERAPALRVTGVDLSDTLLSEARSRAKEAGLGSRVDFKRGDARSLPFVGGSVDLIVSTLSLHHWSDAVGVLNEVDRVLRRPDPARGRLGGAFVIFDLRRDVGSPFRLLLWVATHAVVPRAVRRANEPMASCDASYTPEEVAQLARRSRLSGWCVTTGPLWLTIKGRVASELRPTSVTSQTTRLRAAQMMHLARRAERASG